MAIPLRFPWCSPLLAAVLGLASADAAPPVLDDPLGPENGALRVVPRIPVGKTLVLPLLASDADGDVLSFSVTSSNPKVMARVRTGCPILKIHVSYAGDPLAVPTPSDPFEGEMEFQLFRDTTPATAGNIGGAAQAGFYDNVLFHRVIPGFVIQGGDPTGSGSGDPGFTSDHEFRPEIIFSGRGQLAMANSNGGYNRGQSFGSGLIQLGNFDPTNSSQFFVTISQPRVLDFKHTIFGQLIRGFDVLENVAAVPRDAGDKPKVPVTMTTVSLTPGRSDATLLLSATDTVPATLLVTARDPSGGRATRSIAVRGFRDVTNDPPLLRPIPNIITPIGVAPGLPLRGFDLEHDYLLYGIASVSGNTTAGAIGSARIAQNFTPRSTAGFQDLVLGVAGFNDPLLNAAVTGSNPFAPFDAYRFRVAEIAYGDRAVSADAFGVEGEAGTILTDAILAEFRDGDAAGSAADFTTNVNWGDGSAREASTGTTPRIKIERSTTTPGAYVVKGTHTYAKIGVYAIKTVIDGGLGATARTHGQAVIVAPGTALRVLGRSVANVGSTFRNRVIATFSDTTPGVGTGDFSALIDWGDGGLSRGTIVASGVGRFAVTGFHAYRDPESFAVFVHIARSAPSAAAAVAWSGVQVSGFSAPQHLPPFPAAHLVGQISQAADASGNGIPVLTTTGAGANVQSRFSVSIVVINAGDVASQPGKLRFYLSKDEAFNATASGAEPADIPLLIGTFADGNLPSLQPGAGLRYNLVQSPGSSFDLRLVAPRGRTVASYFVLAHMDYSDPLADKLPISKDVAFGRIDGIKVSRRSLALTEAAGASHAQTFTVVLQGRPASDVVLPLTLSDSQVQTDKPELTFTTQNWQIPQVVTVTAIDDQSHENLPTTTIIAIGPSQSTDTSWNEMAGGSVAATVTDNDP